MVILKYHLGVDMKVLTIKEPWASLIINGYKKYEFRSWKTNYRGKILIHAGLTLEKNNTIKFNNYNLDYGHGEIIGEAYITDCILVDDEFENKLYNIDPLVYGKSEHSRIYAWKLEHIIKYKPNAVRPFRDEPARRRISPRRSSSRPRPYPPSTRSDNSTPRCAANSVRPP